MFSRTYEFVKKRFWTFLAGFIFAVLCFISLNAAMVPFSKSDYCGSRCHEMNTAYLTWELSTHGANSAGVRVECIDCHLPAKDRYFAHMAAKAYEGARDMYHHYFGGEYDLEKIRLRILENLPNKRCLNCHDDLLAKPVDSAARTAHTAVLARPRASENRCLECHENVGHQRHKKLFSP
jgi:cytochrome c-type protein NapC/trimethylamine-N-oxide reductase cytochrome c-type subunit TorC